jgi:cellulose synthase/poly-beta-1,6-N-acetylglucosamine synthase-like glycosyltransferase
MLISRDLRGGVTGAIQTMPLVVFDKQLRRALLKEIIKAPDGFLVYLTITELSAPSVSTEAESVLVSQIIGMLHQQLAVSFVGYDNERRLVFLLPQPDNAQQKLCTLAQQIARMTIVIDGGIRHLSPAIGYISLAHPTDFDQRLTYAAKALGQAQQYNDLQPIQYHPPARNTIRTAIQQRLTTPIQIFISLVLSFGIPFFTFTLLEGMGLDITSFVYMAIVLILLVTSYLVWYEGFQAIREPQLPTQPQHPYPAATAIIAAYLPNEAATIIETVRGFLNDINYPGPFEVILAYNTPNDLPVEKTLQAIARQDGRLRLLRVEGSTSKAQNVNAALSYASGAFIGIFDADHHPAADSFTRAWRWLDQGYDIVQGHCVIRNGDQNWVTKLVAVEFEAIYAVAHPGRTRMHGFGIFGGSNGYWRSEVLREVRLRSSMLTEDIDASMRALLAGYKITNDPLLLSYELAPPDLHALWNQRMRWAQGWYQVALKHTWKAFAAPTLSLRQKFGIFHLLVWRELYPWLSVQVLTILAYWIWHDGLEAINLLVPIFVWTTVLTFSSGPGQAVFAYMLGSPLIRQRWHWYLFFTISSMLYYSGLKNLISRVSMIKETLQDQQWKVTPRLQRVN